MLLILYDGSADAVRALQRAAQLHPGAAATVITIWEPLSESPAARMARGLVTVADFGDVFEIDRASHGAAHGLAQGGAALARDAGLDARAGALMRRGRIGDTILAEARRLHASAIVVGPGPRQVRLSGALARRLVRHATCPVLVIGPEATGALSAAVPPWSTSS